MTWNTPPKPIHNRPGLDQLAYRIGDYGSFRRRLVAALSTALRPPVGKSGEAPLAKLTTRDANDPAIALLDAWAVVADVLTFYQERIANEGFLRTAIERRSVLELARAIGYELDPGVAASTFLSFKVEDAPGSPTVVPIPTGTQIMSVPLKDELPQLFETTEDFTAYLAWNGLRPRPNRPQRVVSRTRKLYLAGTSTQLQPGDLLLLVDDVPERPTYLLPLHTVTPDTAANYTLVQWRESLPVVTAPLRRPQIFAFRLQAHLFGYNAPHWETMPPEVKLAAIEKSGNTIQGGVWRSTSDGLLWTPTSQGLPNQDIICLAVKPGPDGKPIIFAGTPDKGVFRSIDNGQNWKAVNSGLTNQKIQTLHVDSEGDPIYAGTPNGGVFRSKDNGDNWVAINTGSVQSRKVTPTPAGESELWEPINNSIPVTVVRSLLTYSSSKNIQGIGTISSSGKTVIGKDTKFQKEVAVGDKILAPKGDNSDKIREVVSIESDTNLTLNEEFKGNLVGDTSYYILKKDEQKYIFVGTDDGLYRSIDYGQSWQPLGNPDNVRHKAIYSLAYSIKIEKESVTYYLFAGTDAGLYRSMNHGDSWEQIPLSDDRLNNRKILALLTNSRLNSQSESVLVGTNAGLYLLSDYGNSFTNVTFGNSVIHSLTAFERTGVGFAFVATSQGLYRTTAPIANDNVLNWRNTSGSWEIIQSADISSLKISVVEAGEDATVYAGSRFAGFLPGEAEGNSVALVGASSATGSDAQATSEGTISRPKKSEWPNLVIQDPRQLDLDTLYPQILSESWIVLVDDRAPQDSEQQAELRYAVRRVAEIVPLDRADFGLIGKISRLELEVAVEPEHFGLRSARVLGQSTELPLAPEPLTVVDRQHDIFADPLMSDTVYLQTFVQNLQPNQVVMVNGKHMRMQLADVGGVLRSRHPWQPLNTGLNDLTINALAKTSDEDLLVATNAGLYRSPDGKTWEPVSPFRFKAVHSILSEPDFLLVGADLGLYRTQAPDENWVKVNLPIEATVLSFHSGKVASAELVQIGNISGITVKTSETNNTDNLALGTVITAAEQTRIVIKKEPDGQTFFINQIFAPALSTPTSFSLGGTVWLAGTDRGFLRSTDAGKTWEYLEEKRDRQIYCLLSRENQSVVEIFAGTDQGLLYSNDSGQHWNLLETLWEQQSHPAVYALAAVENEVFVGTGRGIFQITGTGPQKLDGLCDRAILSLRFQTNILYAGTDQGIYRSTDLGNTWESLDAGLAPSAGRALLVHNDQLWVGTEQGIFATTTNGQRIDPVNWSRSNTGIVNSQVLSLGSSSDCTTLLAGTTAGLYRSTSGGRTWAPFDDQLDQANAPGKLRIQAVLHQNGHWFVGTPEGVFVYACLPDQPKTYRWQPVGLATLPYPNIRAMAEQGSWLLIGTVSGGLFKLNLDTFDPEHSETQGGSPAEQRWQPTGLNNTDVQTIAVYGEHIYVGTLQDGIFRSLDGGMIWQQITDQRSGSGTLTSDGNQVTWSGFADASLLQAGDQFTAADQTRTILESASPDPALLASLDSAITFTVDEPFRPNLSTSTAFTISTGLTNRDITTLKLVEERMSSQDNAVRLTLYAGTAGSGVFRSNDGGNRWQQVITNLPDLDIRCLICEGTDTVWVGTATAGVFRSINRGELWSAATLNLTNTDVRALLIPHASTLLAGGIGILKSADGLTVKPMQRHDTVQVVKPPQPIKPASVPPSNLRTDPPANLPTDAQPTDLRWLLRDKDDFSGLLDTTDEQIFPLLPAAAGEAQVSEQAQIKYPPTDQQLPILTLQEAITYSYDPATVEIAANVVQATHGETTQEILGSGDGTTANQNFALKKPPLTYVTATNASGAASTLEVRVDDVLWEEVSSLYALKPQVQAYIIRIEDDGTTAITFGDGVRGARPPSGEENITARYRSGIGTEGNVPAHRLSILKTRPQGIAEVTNSLSATGAANPESLVAARNNAPPTARTLGRIVSLQDFQDFAQGFTGIGKAQAVALWDGNTQVVHITIAGTAGSPVPEASALYQSLVMAIDQARDPIQQVEVDSYERLFFNLEAKVLLDARYQAATVAPQLTAVLTNTFAFDHRNFGQSVTSAEVITALQQVKGVIAVDLDALYPVGRSRTLNAALTAQTARYNPDTLAIQPAQLFLLNPVGIQLAFVSTL